MSQKPSTDGTEDSHFKRSNWVTVSGTPQADTAVPGAVGSLEATGGDGKFDLFWTKPSGGRSPSYEVHVTTSTSVANERGGGGKRDLCVGLETDRPSPAQA